MPWDLLAGGMAGFADFCIPDIPRTAQRGGGRFDAQPSLLQSSVFYSAKRNV